MATAGPSEIESDTECPVCSEFFIDPKLLPCAHVVCRGCLLSWLKTNHNALCPLCRVPIVDVAQEERSWDQVVDGLPTDVSTAHLARSKQVLSQEHVCKGCQQEMAKSICLHCGDMLCSTCTKSHGNLTATRHHKVESLSTITPERLSVSQPANCGSHPDKPSELYCLTDKVAICHLCASSEHRACPDLTLFEKHVSKLHQELKSMSDKLKATEDKLDQAIEQLDKDMQEAEQRTQATLTEINEACNRLEKAVRECRKRLEELVKKSKTKFEESVAAEKVVLSDHRGILRSHRRVVDRVQRSVPPGDLEEAMEMIQTRVTKVDQSASIDSNVSSLVVIHIDSKVLTRLERELSFLGQQRSSASSSLPKDTVWTFQSDMKNTLYSNSDMTVERMRGKSVIVAAATPMKTNMLYEVQIDRIKGKSDDVFPCGVVSSPISGRTLPRTTLTGWDDAIVFSDNVYLFGKQMDFCVEDKLKRLAQGTRVGFVRENGGFLHLYIDGEKQWVYTRNAPSTCYVFFELMHIYQKVTALPLTHICKAVDN